MKTSPSVPVEHSAYNYRHVMFIAWLCFVVLNLRAETPTTIVRLQNAGLDLERLPTYRLEWNGVSNATYRVLRSGGLGSGAPWQTLDVVTPASQNGQYLIQGRSIPENSVEFFRLQLPQLEIITVEPAVLAPEVTVNLFVVGQCFGSNSVLQINGVAQTNAVIVSSTLISNPAFRPDVAGSYRVALLVGGVEKSSFNLTCADALTQPEIVLQGPPVMPPASPQGYYLSKKGYDYYQSRSAMTFEVQEGKKGLNAVNVKLARMAAGGSDAGASGSEHTFLMPALTRAKETAHRAKRASVRAFSGEVQLQAVDLEVEGRGLDFVWARTYRSRQTQGATFGERWTHSYDVHCAQDGSGGMVVFDGTGRRDTFKSNANGVYTCPEFFREGTLSNQVFRLTFADAGYWEFKPFDGTATAGKLDRIVDRNGNTMALSYGGSGRLAQIVDDLGRTNTIAYDAAGRVASVTDFSGRTVTYQYYGGKPGEAGEAGDLKSATSPAVLKTPTGNDFPSGKPTTYTYSTGYADDRENHLLLSILDANGDTTQRHIYQHNQTDLEFIRCISIQRGTETPTMLSYLPQTPTPSNQFTVLRCVMNDPQGNVVEEFYDARHRCVMAREFTGRATPGARVSDQANRPSGKVRASDPNFYETRWSWNNDSLCTAEISPGGQRVQCVYEADLDKSTRARKRADCRVVRELACCGGADTDGDGTADLTEKVWRYEYDPRFGSDPTACRGKKLYVGNLPYSPGEVARARGIITIKAGKTGGGTIHGWAAPVGNGVAINIKGTGAVKNRMAGGQNPVSGDGGLAAAAVESAKIIMDRDSGRSKGFGFVISCTDPRGILTTLTYDTHGNCTKSIKQGHYAVSNFSPRVDADYNSHGQLTAITHPADGNGYRRVDTLTYYSTGPQAGYLQSIAIDESGVHLTASLEHDVRGNVTRWLDPRGNDALFTYNELDQCLRNEPPVNLTARCATDFFYDANDNLVQCATEVRNETDALAGTKVDRARYDALHRLTEIALAVDATHALTNRFVYDGNDQCVLALGGDAVSGADPRQAVACQYDERGNLFRESGAPGSPDQSTTQWDCDANGLVTRVSEGLESEPSITSFEYDGFAGCRYSMYGVMKAMSVSEAKPMAPRESLKKFDWAPKLEGGKEGLTWVETVWNKQCVEKDTTVSLAKIIDPMGNVTTFNYDANDNLKIARHFGETNDVAGTNGNIRLAESRCEYDGLDRCVRFFDVFFELNSQSAIGDGARTTTLAYAPNGQCTSVTDDLGRVTTFGYDTACRLTSVGCPGEKSLRACVLDAAGNALVLTQTDRSDLGGAPQVFARTNVYDALNRCVRATDNAGNSSHCAYDSLGRIAVLFNPREYSIRCTYDLRGRRTLAIGDLDGDGLPDLAHDISNASVWSSSSDRLLATMDSHGNLTSYTYDSLGRCTQITGADGTHHSFVWGPHSTLLQETDANGTVFNHTCDLNDRRTASTIAAAAGVASTTTFEMFTYDGLSRLVMASNNVSQIDFGYDSMGNVEKAKADCIAAVATFDSEGNRLSLTYPGGRALAFGYDALNQCTNIMESGKALVSCSYAGPGRVARVAYGNGTRTQITYDGLVGIPNSAGDFGHGRISGVTHGFSGATGAQKIAGVTLQWDRNGNKTLRADMIFPPAIPHTNELGLQYDAADRLIRASLISGSTLLRDTFYGLDRMGNRTNVLGAMACSGNYFLDLSPPALDYQMNQYSATPCAARSYDSNGNLLSRGNQNYLYDCHSRLVLVQAVDPGTGALAPVASYTYDALGRRASRTVYAGGLPPRTTQFLFDGEDVIEEREGGVLRSATIWPHMHQTATHIRVSATGERSYAHADDQGNVLVLTGANGAALERYDYDDYGAVTFLTGDGVPTSATASAAGNVYCWGGLRLDPETGFLCDDGGGYFEPQVGRKITPKIAKESHGKFRVAPGNNPWSGGGGLHAQPKTRWNNDPYAEDLLRCFSSNSGADGELWSFDRTTRGVNVSEAKPQAPRE